jgi:outer membrane protein assembly factor BamA
VREGGLARIESVRFEGASEDEECLQKLAKLEIGAEYDKEAVGPAVQRLRDYYLKLGHPSVRVTPRVSASGKDVVLTFRMDEGDAVTVGAVVINGLRRTRESLVRRQIESTLRVGDPLDPRKLALAERRLLELGVFSRAIASTSGNPATVTFDLEEQGPYALAYQVRYSQEERGSGLVDAEVGNLAGRGLALGARWRQGTDVREARGSFHVPAVGRAGDFTASVFRQEDDFLLIQETTGLPARLCPTTTPRSRTASNSSRRSTSRTRGTSSTATASRGYRAVVAGPIIDLAGIQTSLVRDTRDNALNPSRGRFWSVSLDLGPRLLGSGLDYFRTFGQTFTTRSFTRSLAWAQGYRLGLANGLDDLRLQQLELFGTSTELFRAGGANSLRGYATDSVGPPGRSRACRPAARRSSS